MESKTWSEEIKPYTGLGDYTFSFPAYYKRQVLVRLEDLTTGEVNALRLYEDYDVVFNNGGSYGGTLTLLKEQNSGNLIVSRDMRLEQNIDYRLGAKLHLPGLESKADTEMRVIQQVMRRYEETIASPWWRGPWVANRQYRVGELVTDSSFKIYIVAIAHTSSVLATDETEGKIELFFSGDNIASYLPGISGGDALKMLRCNLGETALEHGLAVVTPVTGGRGKIPVSYTADATYDQKHFQKMPHPRFQFTATSGVGLLLSGWAEYDYHDWGSYYGDYTSSQYDLVSLNAGVWSFVYFDGSDTASSFKIEVGWQIYDTSEVPTYDKTKGGWYNAAGDLCIFMVYGTSTTTYRQFYHSGDRNVWWRDSILEYSTASFPATTWTSRTLAYAPSVCDLALLNLLWGNTGGAGQGYLRVRPLYSAAALGRNVGYSNGTTKVWDSSGNRRFIVSGATKTLSLYSTATTVSTLSIYNEGFVLPKGM